MKRRPLPTAPFLADKSVDHNREITRLFVARRGQSGHRFELMRQFPRDCFLMKAAGVGLLNATPIFCLLALSLAGCAHLSFQDRARTPLKPMVSVVRKETDAFDTPPRVLEGNRPEYPEPEGERRQKGFVSIICTINAQGQLTEFEIESATDPAFAYEAARAIAKWKFAPAKKNGHPVAGKLRVPMHFNAL
jgi:protein TonB